MRFKRTVSVLIGGLVLASVLLFCKNADGMEQMQMLTIKQEQQNNAEAEDDETNSILIPGFDYLTFRTGVSNQTIRNPERNQCYFQIRIVMPDGRVIFDSDMIAPGEQISKIRLNTVLTPGTYEDARLQYTCYSLDALQLINGATIKFTLEVR